MGPHALNYENFTLIRTNVKVSGQFHFKVFLADMLLAMKVLHVYTGHF